MQAAYAQVKFKKNDSSDIEIEFDIQATKKGAVLLTINEELTDEDTELGDYTIQIRLLNANKNSVVTLPPVESCIHILAPLFEKLGADTNEVNKAVVNKAVARYAAPLPATTEDGTFNSKAWVEGDKITTAELNRIEQGIKTNSTQYKDIAKEVGTARLNTTAQDLKGAINEVFQSASNGKTLIANAITGKGVTTNPSDSFQTMATNIGNIKTTTNTVGQNPLNKCGSRKFKFAIFSDVHTKADTTQNPNVKLREAIAKVQELGCAFIAVTGDLCNYDVENELNQYKAEIDAHATIPVYEVTGNHDATQHGLNATLWKTITGQDPYYEIIHENEVFLFVSQANWSDDNNSKLFPKEYQDWLTSKLEEHKTKNRVFLFFINICLTAKGLDIEMVHKIKVI